MKVCVCIPARYNSQRLPGKLMYKFNNDLTTIELTYLQVKKCNYVNDIYILTDHIIIYDYMKNKYNANIILTSNCINGTERISKYLHMIPDEYNIIVNIQADEPFIDYRNIDFAISKFSNDSYYTTLHQKIDDLEYLKSTSCVKVMVNKNNDVLLYSRNIIPWNKDGKINNNINYYGFTGIYVFNRELLKNYHIMDNTPYQLEEDIEQLRILENGYKIKSYECPYYNEISLNDENDYKYLLNKYQIK
jgi:3-deoxy-manno-octulosonate cytidylyltransferase (CMP-KDO synthetase)